MFVKGRTAKSAFQVGLWAIAARWPHGPEAESAESSPLDCFRTVQRLPRVGGSLPAADDAAAPHPKVKKRSLARETG